MFVQYYSLKDPKKLPPKGYFSDPVDSTVYYPLPSESLQEFINRIEASREEKGLDKIDNHSMEVLITTSLSHTADQRTLDTYFTRKSATPSMGQLINLAKTIISQRLSGKQVDYNTRQKRAKACTGCRLHQPKSSVAWAASTIINKAASLETLQESDTEQKLGVCRACGCGLRSKNKFDIMPVLVSLGPADIVRILEVYREDSYNKCWILKEAINRSDTKALLEKKVATLPQNYASTLTAHYANSIQKAKTGNR